MRKRSLALVAILALALIGFGVPMGAIADTAEESQTYHGPSLPPKTKGDCYFPHSPCQEDYIPSPVEAEPKAASYDGNGWGTQSIGYNIFIEKHFPKRVYSNQPYEYTIEVTNLSDVALENVNIIETFPKSFKVLSTDPAIYDTSGEKVAWALGQMGPKEKRIITVRGMAENGDSVPCCTQANFKHPDLCLATEVVDPGLKLNVSAPQEVLRCDVIPLEFVVQNSGQTEMNNIVIMPNIPGATNAEGKPLTLNVGDLASGQSKTIRTVVDAQAAGAYSFSGIAEGSPALLYEGAEAKTSVQADSGSVNVKVLNPELKVTATTGGRNKQVIGRAIDYNFEVTNTGNGNADGSTLIATIPSNASFRSASDNGSKSGSSVSWDLGSIRPGGTRNVSMTLVATSAGSAGANASVEGVCVNTASAAASLPVVGVPALLLEAIDSVDPLEIGDSTQYEIRVTNQGNGPATNIRLTGSFEDMRYITSQGHTPIENTDKNLTFGSFSLEPKQTVSWVIQLEAAAVGDQRFKIIMNSDQLTRPVEETESTTIY